MIDGELADPGEQRGLARVPLRALAILGRGPLGSARSGSRVT